MTDTDDITTVIALHEATSAATIARDAEAFVASFAPELIVNSPGNRVLSREGVARAFDVGLIDDAACRTTIEHAARRANGEVVLMGAEEVEPRARRANAGQTVTYRFTEVWRLEGERWLLSLRDATICAVR